MRILVTGSKGTLGTRLVQELKNRGYEVWGCDLQHQRDDNYIRADVSNFRQMERVFEGDDGTYWPDFDQEEFYKAICDYQGRERRFGKTSEQIIA